MQTKEVMITGALTLMTGYRMLITTHERTPMRLSTTPSALGRLSRSGANVWIPLQVADPDLSKRHGVHQRLEKPTLAARLNDLPKVRSLSRQDEEPSERLLLEPAGSKCHQQSLREIHEKWKSSKDRSRTLPQTGHPLLI